MAIAGVSLEVNPASAYSPDDEQKEPLTLVRRGDRLGVLAEYRGRTSFSQRVTVNLDGEPEGQGPRLGFREWRIGIRASDDFLALWEIGPSAAA
ncbi:hypothetical protein [Sphingomonas sp. OTU376]|uniref:hypothetical protein n=1 Tax=Sphingomonas sp. OTU376 TaxID=3043863 RepID=UPI00313D0C82